MGGMLLLALEFFCYSGNDNLLLVLDLLGYLGVLFPVLPRMLRDSLVILQITARVSTSDQHQRDSSGGGMISSISVYAYHLLSLVPAAQLSFCMD
jgi:hypothetical protein